MTQTYTIQFLHRLNDDGTIDSICRECFVTIATALSRGELQLEERKHHCEPELLERYKNHRPHGKIYPAA